MPVFEIEAHGETFEVDAPDQGKAIAAFSKLTSIPLNAPDASAPDPTKQSLDLPVPDGQGGIDPAYTPASRAQEPAPAPEQTPAAPGPTGYDDTHFAQGTSGVNEGIANTLGFPVDATQGALRLGAAGLNAVAGTNIQLPVDAAGGSRMIKDAMGPSIKAESNDPSKQMLRRVGEEIGSSIIPAGGVAARAARPLRSLATSTAVTLGSGAGAAAAERLAPDNPYAEIAGQILGGGLVAAGVKGAQKLITPFEISPERQAQNAVMAREGVDLTAGQATGSKGLQYAESELGGGSIANLTERQQEQFTSAALSRAGIAANRATPEVMDDAFTTIGAQFDNLAANNVIIPDRQFGQELADVSHEYNSLVNASARAPVVRDTLADVVDLVRTGQIDGATYSALRSRLARQARGTADNQLRGALQGIAGALDDAMERSIAANNPAEIGAFQQARSDYRNLIVLEDAAGRAGEKSAMGIITPASLRSAVQKQNKRAYVRGRGDFADLARGGAAAMSELPQSGTAPRQAVRNVGAALPAVIGSGAGGSVAGIPGAIGGAALGAAVPAIVGRAITSPVGRRYLSNQVWTGAIGAGAAARGPALSAVTQQTGRPSTNALARRDQRMRALN